MSIFYQLTAFKPKIALMACVISLTALFITGCKKENNPSYVAAISLVHASPGLEALDFHVDTVRVHGSKPIYYLDSVPYLIIDKQYSFWVKRNSSTHTYIYGTLNLTSEKFHTLFITGKPDTVKSLLTEDDLSSPESGKAKLRFINLCPDASLDVEIGDEKYINQTFMSYTAFKNISPAVYPLTFSKAGTANELVRQNLTIESGKIYTVIATGLISSIIDSLSLGTKIIIN